MLLLVWICVEFLKNYAHILTNLVTDLLNLYSNDASTLPLEDVAFLYIRIAGMPGKSSFSVMTLLP
ncbi:MAG: hypothetical protein K9G11_00985 [Rickettsiaceae bacterium]|nr:hypothetical protein [Rickettsiaceae bacterium]